MKINEDIKALLDSSHDTPPALLYLDWFKLVHPELTLENSKSLYYVMEFLTDVERSHGHAGLPDWFKLTGLDYGLMVGLL